MKHSVYDLLFTFTQ